MPDPAAPPPLPVHREVLRVTLAGLHAALAATAVWVLCLTTAQGPSTLPNRYLLPALLLLWCWSAALLAWETTWRRLEGRTAARVAVSVLLVPTLALALVQVGCWGVAMADGLGVAGMPTVLGKLGERRIAGPLLGLYAGSLVPFCALLLLRDWRPRRPGLDWIRYGLLVLAGLAGSFVYGLVTFSMDFKGPRLFGGELHTAFLFVPLVMALGCHTEAYIGALLRPAQDEDEAR